MSAEFAKYLKEKRASVREEQKALLDVAIEAKRDLTAEEQSSFDKMDADIISYGESVRKLEESLEEDRSIAAAFAKIDEQPNSGPDKRREERTEQLRSFLKGNGQREYNIPVEVRADQTTTTGAGVIPAGFYGQLWEYLIETSSVLQLGPQILRTQSGETIKLPRATAHSTAGAVTEGSAISASDPTLSSVNSTVTKEGYLTQFTKELLDDTGVDLEGYLARSAGTALGNAVGAAAVTAAIAAASAGVTAGNGIGAVTSFGTQSTEGEGFDFLIDLYYSVIAPYRNSNSCGWLMSDIGASKVRKLKSADGVYAWQPSVVVGAPDLVLGKPVLTDTNVADPAASAKSILFGDWSSLVVRIAGGFRFERSDDFAFDADMTTFRALTRHGTVSVDANALKSFVHAAS
ncbi:phage major capsid protein [Aeromicrobium sp.]|uniref:phage major capsid protein n=1 Tax=Aeromicrobium sp. TaxID=1871063 RepID=UPI002FC5D40D